ncbi:MULTISPECIES: PadR family transcriptional regulator [Clostridium]|uniref:PadR family transcriptional regulator n=1 Tax=Clostridium aquiflavi TaxID=3073603 RepID=A0ABU1EFY4_9CLOT|nr:MULTISPECIES: PadR family transcriptional regulator [unclassified Clostridium]MDR5587078.1 PadR family transcriptional regulator [Clostridium sp. 5N-1]NFG61282.1 PadR family transcriptional regulator [Clostridium botulinum]NFQ09247.1 PadR family transcriptional regulator [Clostridium botulinum]
MAFQLGAALLDACVLAVLSRGDTYGYVLTQQVRSIMNISESTLYPVLRRLQKNECLTTYDQAFQGRNRRYYKITEKGKTMLSQYLNEWEQYKENVDKVLLGGILGDE